MECRDSNKDKMAAEVGRALRVDSQGTLSFRSLLEEAKAVVVSSCQRNITSAVRIQS